MLFTTDPLLPSDPASERRKILTTVAAPEDATDPATLWNIFLAAVADEATDPASDRSVSRTNAPLPTTDPTSNLIDDFDRLAALDTLPTNERDNERSKLPAVVTPPLFDDAVSFVIAPDDTKPPDSDSRFAPPLPMLGPASV